MAHDKKQVPAKAKNKKKKKIASTALLMYEDP